MFKYSLDHIDELYESADKLILPQRQSMNKYIKIIEKFITDRNLLKSNINELVAAFSSKKPSINIMKLSIVIYSGNALIDANDLANELALVNDFVVMTTPIYKKEFQIAIEGNKFITFKNVETHKNILLIEVMKPVFGYVAPEIEILGVYKKLFNPHYAGEWDELIEQEEKLHDICKSRLETIRGYTKGGGTTAPMTFLGAKEAIILYLMKSYSKQLILVGEVAYDIHTNDYKEINKIIKQGEKKLQYIGSVSPEELMHALNKLGLGYNIIYRKQSLRLPIDERQQKYTFYIESGCEDNDDKCFIIFELFNNIEYELVPYSTVKINDTIMNIGTMQINLYIAYIDIWVIQLISAIGQLHDSSKFTKLQSLYDQIDKYRKVLLTQEYLNQFKKYKFYMGTFIDEVIFLKQLMVANNVPSYIPAVYKKSNNKYRTITSAQPV